MHHTKIGLLELFLFLNVFSRSVVAFIPISLVGPMSLQLGARTSAEDVLRDPKFPIKWPYSPIDFSRQDEANDLIFYDQARLVTHIDDKAIAALTKYYSIQFMDGAEVLDICSSWISHFPKDVKLKRAVGLGMNQFELQKNPQLTSYVTKDLNRDPVMPFDDNSFDFVTCVVSVDYLTRPLEVFKEINRVLKPGGKAIISQSNRCFPSKAINIWLNTNDLEHVFIVGSYFHYAGGFSKPEALDISPGKRQEEDPVQQFFAQLQGGGSSDPMFIIEATKEATKK